MTPALEVRDLVIEYRHGVRAVDGVNLRVEPGQTLGVVGESGSGKSSVARAILGLTKPSSGVILLEGEDLAAGGRGAGRTRRRVQMVFQDPFASLNPRLTIGSALQEVIGRNAPRDARDKPGDLLELVELPTAMLGRYPHEMSGGQRQRVAIARALAARPRVLIADEVTSALDASVQASILNLLTRLQRETGIAYLFISHNLAVVRYVSDHVSVMQGGRVVESAPRDILFDAPRDPYTRRLLDAAPALPTSAERN